MGAASPREKIEKKMLELKYKRVEIQEEKEERLEQLKKLLGKNIIRKPIPDYIDENNETSTKITKREKRSNPIKKKIKKHKTKKSSKRNKYSRDSSF